MPPDGSAPENMMTEAQLDRVIAHLDRKLDSGLPKAVSEYLDKHADLGADASGLAGIVTDKDSQINQFSVQVPESASAVLNADIFVWSDIVPNGFQTQQAGYTGATIGPADLATFASPTPLIGTVSTSTTTVVTITSAQFATAGFGWQPPSWLLAPGGAGGGSGYFLGQQYQLTLMYLQQSVAMFSTLNMTSNENSQQAPVITSAQILLNHKNPYGVQQSSQAPMNDAIDTDQYRQNQIIITLHWVISVFDWINLSTVSPSGGSTNVTFGLTFHSQFKKATAATFETQANKARAKNPPTPSRSRQLPK